MALVAMEDQSWVSVVWRPQSIGTYSRFEAIGPPDVEPQL